MSSTRPTPCSRRPPPSSRNPPGRASGRRRCASGACSSAACGFPPTSATRNSPATARPGRAPRSASTAAWASTASAFAGLHLEERFDTRDEQVLFGYAARLGDDWSYGVSGDFAPDAEILPEWSVAAEAGRACRTTGASASACATRATRPSTSTRSRLSLDKYVDAYSVGYSLNAAKTSGIDDPSFGHLLRVARDYGTGSRAATRRRFRRGSGDRRARRRAGDGHEEHRAHRPALDEHGLGHHLGGGLVRTGRPLRPLPDSRWTRAPVLNSSSRWRGAAPRSPASARRRCSSSRWPCGATSSGRRARTGA